MIEIDYKNLIENLPIGLYQVDKIGKFIFCNPYLANLLGYSDVNELIGKKIIDCYIFPRDREKIISKMRTGNKGIANEFLYWKDKSNKKIILSDFCQFVYDENERESGARGIVVDLWFIRLFDDVNTGFYQIGADLKTISNLNPVVAKIFGYDDIWELEGTDVGKLYKNHYEMEKFINELKDNEHIENYPTNMVKKDCSEIVISLNASLLKNENGKIIGREGTFTDITEQSKKLRILEDMPTGAYQAKKIGAKTMITYCNKAFANMFGYNTPDEVINIMEAKDFHASDEEYRDFEKMLSNTKEGEALLEYRLHGKKKNKEKFWVEIDSHLLKDHNKNIIGRQGTTRDATVKVQYEVILADKDKVQSLAHRFMAPMIAIKSTTETFIEEYIKIIQADSKNTPSDLINSILNNQLTQLKEIFNQTKFIIHDLELLNVRIIETEAKMVIDNFILNLNQLSDEQDLGKLIELRVEEETLQLYLEMMSTDLIKDEDSSVLHQHVISTLFLINKIWLLFLAQTIKNTQEIANMGIENLRSFLVRWGKTQYEEKYEYSKQNICQIIQDVVNIYQIYAFEKGLAIIVFEKIANPFITISRDHIIRMFHYVIENAVKYSFHNRGGYINVNIEENNYNFIIEIENYGVGILPDEIDQDKIFEHGYRGKLSTDYNPVGSGIGLSEAKKIIERHNGGIEVTSKQIIKKDDTIKPHSPDKKTPFKTIVKIIFPKK